VRGCDTKISRLKNIKVFLNPWFSYIRHLGHQVLSVTSPIWLWCLFHPWISSSQVCSLYHWQKCSQSQPQKQDGHLPEISKPQAAISPSHSLSICKAYDSMLVYYIFIKCFSSF
jgi:hypothetical protein